MTRTLFYSLGFALALALCAAPLSDAVAGQTVTINDDVGGNVVGNGPGPNDTAPDFPDDLLDPKITRSLSTAAR